MKHLASLQHHCRTKAVLLPDEAAMRRYVDNFRTRANALKSSAKQNLSAKVIVQCGFIALFFDAKLRRVLLKKV
jgi:hypothetical protein